MKKHGEAMFCGRILLSAMADSDFRKIDLHGAQAFDPALDGLAECDETEAGNRSRRHQMARLEAAAMIPDKPGKGAKDAERVSAGNRSDPVKDRLARNLKACGDTRKIHACPVADRLAIHQAGIDLVVGEFPQGMSRFVIGEARINQLDRRQRRDATAGPVGEFGICRIGKHTINPECHFEFDADQLSASTWAASRIGFAISGPGANSRSIPIDGMGVKMS